jgi:hypothetical protein
MYFLIILRGCRVLLIKNLLIVGFEIVTVIVMKIVFFCITSSFRVENQNRVPIPSSYPFDPL